MAELIKLKFGKVMIELDKSDYPLVKHVHMHNNSDNSTVHLKMVFKSNHEETKNVSKTATVSEVQTELMNMYLKGKRSM